MNRSFRFAPLLPAAGAGVVVMGCLLAPTAASADPVVPGATYLVCSYPGRINPGDTLPAATTAQSLVLSTSAVANLVRDTPFVFEDDVTQTTVIVGTTTEPPGLDTDPALCPSGSPQPSVPTSQIARDGIVACLYPLTSTPSNLGTAVGLEVLNLFEILPLGFNGVFPQFLSDDDPETTNTAVALRYLSPLEEEPTDTCPTGSLVPPVVTPPVVTPPATPVAAKAPVAALPEVGAADPTPGILGALLVLAGSALLMLRRRSAAQD